MNTVAQELIEKTYEELSRQPSLNQESRSWSSTAGYKYLIPWSNAVFLRYLIRLHTLSLPKSEYRRKAQADDAARSVVRNIEEGFKRATTSPYLEFLSFSQGSLEEVKGDVRELTEDGFLPSKPGSSLASIGINLKAFNDALKPKPRGNLKESKETLLSFNNPLKSSNPPLKSPEEFAYRHLTVLYPPLVKVHAQDLTYEIFTELINKTDYLLRVLVVSLEKKLADEKKYYQVERARIKDNLAFR